LNRLEASSGDIPGVECNCPFLSSFLLPSFSLLVPHPPLPFSQQRFLRYLGDEITLRHISDEKPSVRFFNFSEKKIFAVLDM